MEDNTQAWGFNILPKEIKQLIFSFTELDLPTILRAQSVSSEFKRLCWDWLRDYDSSLFASKERTSVVAAYFITRVNPSRIRRIDFSEFDHPIASATKLINKFPHLQYVELGHLEDPSCSRSNTKIWFELAEKHPQLCEVSYTTDGNFWDYTQCSLLRQNVTRICDEKTTRHSFKFRLFDYSPSATPFIQQRPVAFHRAYRRGGMISDSLMVVGATDGTLTFLTIEATNSIVIHSTIKDLHNAAINVIWCEKSGSVAWIASADGIITSWKCKEDGVPELEQTVTIPEAVLFVCDFAASYLLAAGKRSLYIYDIHSSKIVRKVDCDEDITGLFSNSNTGRAHLSTTNQLYSVNKDLHGDVLAKMLDTPCPNLLLSPDGSLRAVVLSDQVHYYDLDDNSNYSGDAYTGSFDARPQLARFSPIRYWLSVSLGSSICTFDLERKVGYAAVSPHISRSEIAARDFPTCSAFWYSMCGHFLFGLFSNNTLYWWFIPFYE